MPLRPNRMKTVKQGLQGPTQPTASTRTSSTWLWRNLRNGATYTTRRRASASLEARLGNPSQTFTQSKPLDLDTCPALTHPPDGFVVQPTTQSMLGFEAKPLTNRQPWFWGSTKKLSPPVLRPNRKNHPSGFETKPLINRQPWFWCSTKKLVLLISTCTVQTAHGATRPLDHLTIEYTTCVTIPGPLHQVSYSCQNPCRCTPCRTCHQNTTRQANTISKWYKR
jgi:hypothetical protein